MQVGHTPQPGKIFAPILPHCSTDLNLAEMSGRRGRWVAVACELEVTR